jgi:hypothetical protein
MMVVISGLDHYQMGIKFGEVCARRSCCAMCEHCVLSNKINKIIGEMVVVLCYIVK